MPAKNPRINLVLEGPVYESVKRLAASEGVSLSLKARELIKEALETYEDEALAKLAEKREATLERSNTLDHSEVW